MKNLKKLSIAIVVLLCLSVNTNMKGQLAQVNAIFNFHNDLGCAVKLQYAVYDNSSCTSICSSGNISLAANGGNYQLQNFSGCSNPNIGCRIKITIIDIGGTPTFTIIDSTNASDAPDPQMPVTIGNLVPGCTTPSTFYTIHDSHISFHD
jgi:hypothetical protein